MFLIALVQTKAISCNSANKSCLLEVVHTKAIVALTQFCDFFTHRPTDQPTKVDIEAPLTELKIIEQTTEVSFQFLGPDQQLVNFWSEKLF